MTRLVPMMTVDVGNSFTKVGVWHEGVCQTVSRIPTPKTEAVMDADPGDLPDVACPVIIASVVPEATPYLTLWLTQRFPHATLHWLTRENSAQWEFLPLDLSVYPPNQLGADRIAHLMGAWVQFPHQSVLVASFGTAATLDLLDPSGQFLGGAIGPGVIAFQSWLKEAAIAQLPDKAMFQPPEYALGRNTAACLQTGLYYGYRGMVLEWIHAMLAAVQWTPNATTLVFTGGDAVQVHTMVQDVLPSIVIAPDLTMAGLYQLGQLKLAGSVKSSPMRQTGGHFRGVIQS